MGTAMKNRYIWHKATIEGSAATGKVAYNERTTNQRGETDSKEGLQSWEENRIVKESERVQC